MNSRAMVLLPLLASGLALILLLSAATFGSVSLEAMIVVLLVATVVGLFGPHWRQPLLLRRLMVMTYVLPFSISLGYLNSGAFSWGSPSMRWMTGDKEVMSHVMLIGVVGLISLIAGQWCGDSALARSRLATRRKLTDGGPGNRYIPLPVYVAGLLVAVGLSWLGSPSSQLFGLAYGAEGTQARANDLNLNAAALLGYLILMLLLLEAMWNDRHDKMRRIKIGSAYAALLFILVYLQILRGDREALTLVLGVAALYLALGDRPRGAVAAAILRSKALLKRTWVIGGVLCVMFLVFMTLGGIRSSMQGEYSTAPSIGEAIKAGYEQNTWTAVYHTNVANSLYFTYGDGDYLYGRTYFDYLLSLPPGPLTKALGIDRPLERTSGPAWWAEGIGKGGVHVTVVPYRNGGMAGLIVALFAIGYGTSRLEALAFSKPVDFRAVFAYATVTGSTVRWFWYGDMFAVRAATIVLLLYGLYRLSWRFLPRGRFNTPVRGRVHSGQGS